MTNKNNKDLIGKKIKTVPVEQKEIGIDITQDLTTKIVEEVDTSNIDMNVLNSFSSAAQTREEVYTLIDTMAQDDTISAILETYAEDAVEPNENGKIMWCESDNVEVLEYVNYLLDSLNIEKNIYGWTHSLIKYGDLYLRLYRKSDYGEDLLFKKSNNKLNDDKESLKEDIIIKLNDSQDHYTHYIEAVSNPGEMFELTKFGKSMGYIKAPTRIQTMQTQDNFLNNYLSYNMKKSDVEVYDATTFVHAYLEDNSNRTPEEVNIFLNEEDLKNNKISSSYTVRRGQSILYNSFKIWRELSLLENSVLLNRLTKSAIVRILNVDVGDMPKEQVASFMQRLKEKIEQKSAINAGNSITEYTNPGPIENIIYVPTHGTQGTISAQAIGGEVDVKGLADIDYFQNKLFGSLRIPKQYFSQTDDSTGFNGGTSLSLISSRYGKTIKRVQNTLCQCITDVINLFLLDNGMTSSINKFTIRMQTPITQEEKDRRDSLTNQISVVRDVMDQINEVVTDDVLKIKIMKSLLSNAITDTNVITLLQNQIDILEKTKKEGEESDEEQRNEGFEPFERESSSSFSRDLSSIEREEESNDFELNENSLIEKSEEEFSQEESQEEISQEESEESYLPSAEELNIDMTTNGQF